MHSADLRLSNTDIIYDVYNLLAALALRHTPPTWSLP